MKNRNAFVAIVATTVLVLAGCSRKEKPIHGALPENVIAMVAATPIATATFESELNRQRGADKHAVLDRLVRRELLLAEAQRTGFAESPEIQEAWRNFVINRFAEKMQSQMEELPAPTIEELQACYQARIDLYNVPERVHIALIQLRLSPSVGAERKEALTARATALRDQAVAQAHFSGSDQRVRTGGLDLEITQRDVAERADRGVADGDLSVHGTADAGQNYALEERGTGGHEVDDHQEYKERAQDPGDGPEPAASSLWCGCDGCYFSHN